MLVREYSLADREACLAIFDSVDAKFFALHERRIFAEFLDALPGPYFVAEDENEILGCGGYALAENASSVVLCWGMVRADRHGRGIGTLLLQTRLERIRRGFPGVSIMLNTSQHTRGFFEKFGFEATTIVIDGYSRGIDQVEMYLPSQGGAAPIGLR